MARRKHRGRATGGGVHEFNAKGTPVMELAKKTHGDGFKSGGMIARKRGGEVVGEEAEERMDTRARGGGVPHRAHGGSVRGMKSKGGSPMSTAHSLTEGGGSDGHEGSGRPGEV